MVRAAQPYHLLALPLICAWLVPPSGAPAPGTIPEAPKGFEVPTLPSGTTAEGNCGETVNGDCSTAGARTSGAWSGHAPGGGGPAEGVPKSLEECVAKCLACPSAKCTYISFSAINADCSWYESCDMAKLYTVPGKTDYKSQVVRGADGSGWSLVATLLATVAVYLVAGLIYGSRAGNSESGLAAHPHYAKFISLHGLVLDGVAYVRGRRGTTGATRYSPLTSSGSNGKKSSLAEDDDVAPRPHKDSVKAKTSKRSKSSKRHSEQRKDSHRGPSPSSASDRAEQVAPALGNPSAPAGSKAAGTASAGGGRWVHVPN